MGRALLGSALCVLPLLFASTAARADDKQECVTAVDEAQRLRDERKLVKARAQMLSCARDVCPEPVRKDCLKWLADLETSLSTVTLAARDAQGHDFVVVRVSLDGARLTDNLDGRAIFVDPGPHTFRFEVAGKPPIEQQVVVREGERNRAVTAVFDVAEPPPPPERKTPLVGYVVAGAGALALGGAAFFWIHGKSDIDDLRSTCGATHACAQNDVDAARTKLVIGDVIAGLGIVAIGVGAYMIVSDLRSPSAARVGAWTPRLDFLPVRGGAVGSFRAAF